MENARPVDVSGFTLRAFSKQGAQAFTFCLWSQHLLPTHGIPPPFSSLRLVSSPPYVCPFPEPGQGFEELPGLGSPSPEFTLALEELLWVGSEGTSSVEEPCR